MIRLPVSAGKDADRLDFVLRVLGQSDGDDPVPLARAALQRAQAAGGGGLRQQYLGEAQRQISRLHPQRAARTVHELTGHVLALQGRGRDTKIAHVTPGEVIISAALQTPELLAFLSQEAQRLGIAPASLQVGSPRGNFNPRTGHQEFDLDSDKSIEGFAVATPEISAWHPGAPALRNAEMMRVEVPQFEGRDPLGSLTRGPVTLDTNSDPLTPAVSSQVAQIASNDTPPAANDNNQACKEAAYNCLSSSSPRDACMKAETACNGIGDIVRNQGIPNGRGVTFLFPDGTTVTFPPGGMPPYLGKSPPPPYSLP